MKKLFSILCAAALLILMSGCNKTFIDFQHEFDYALVRMPDGTSQQIELTSWNDYDGEQIQLTAKDGTVYLVSSINCVLIRKAAKHV